jgi:hypothetical protein
MKRLLSVATIACLLLLSRFGDASADGLYDGEWSGFAISTGRRCTAAVVTMTVEGTIVLGHAKFEADASNIHGTVWADGAFGATIGFLHLTGKFVENQFSGTFKNSECVWKMFLTRIKLPPETNAITASRTGGFDRHP